MNTVTAIQCVSHRPSFGLAAWLIGLGALMGTATQTFAVERYDCLISPMTTVAIGTPESGVVDSVDVRRGDRVLEGATLLQLDSSLQEAELRQAMLRAEMAGEREARQADLLLAELKLARAEHLHAEKILPDQERDEAVAALALARAALAQAEDNHQLRQLELDRAKQKLDRRWVRSPIDGVVVEQHVYPGESVVDDPVITVAQTDPLRVDVVLSGQHFGRYLPGDPTVVYPEISNQNSADAIIDTVDAVLDPKSGTFGLTLRLPNPDGRITSGQKCTVLMYGIAAALPPPDTEH